MAAMKVHHRFQAKSYSCGAACFSMFFPAMSEDEARKRCDTRMSGTYLSDIRWALKELGFESHLISVNLEYEAAADYLISISNHYPIILSCEIRSRHSERGRDRRRQHAVILCVGVVYDPSERSPMPYEAYQAVFNKSLKVCQMLIVESEVEGYGRRKVA